MTARTRTLPRRRAVRVATVGLTAAAALGAAGTASAADGYFTSGPRVTVSHPYALTTGDVNRDGRPDLVAAGVLPYAAHVFLGTPGGFTAAPDVPTDRSPSDLLLADIDRDGDEDLAVTTDRVQVALGNGAGAFTTIPGPPVTQSFAIARLDADGDGRPDLAVTSSAGLAVRTGAVGAYGVPVFNTSASFASELGSVAAGDVNGDGRDDVLTAHGGGYLRLHRNTGDFTFADSDSLLFGAITDMAVAD
ncbi:MAG TPA: VCBS repeat-containing protein, partial [Miltoncostaea sp.]|nr:VCBS repeat-containing protein [Miltoncostaea sp.]